MCHNKHQPYAHESISKKPRTVMASETEEAGDVIRSFANISLDDEEEAFVPEVPDRNAAAEKKGEIWTIVGKFLMDRAVKGEFMKHVKASVWRTVCGMPVRDISRNRFLFHFFHPSDMHRVIDDDPWAFENATLVVWSTKTFGERWLVPVGQKHMGFGEASLGTKEEENLVDKEDPEMAKHPSSLLNRFGDCIDECGLAQVPFVGYPFTWEKSKGKPEWVEEKLDRALALCSWLDLFPSAKVVNHLMRHSDHSALWTGCQAHVPNVSDLKMHGYKRKHAV
ncbi:hypothetical protein DM860_000505 [Cuscuta australis]|uniref:DUF4283 domain-containing protein n=1 Tax=Cuscuta australis TaxID=267555 RepID=A0A328CZR2_9ASTE|nr:hypothetical protein DM860_000505 [Cuscuta australis]